VRDSKFIIFSDSLSSLQDVLGFRLANWIWCQKIIKDYIQLVISGNTNTYNSGNDTADTAAKAVLCSFVTSMKSPAADFLPRLEILPERKAGHHI